MSHHMSVFLGQHSIVHSAEVSGGETEWSLADAIIQGLTDDQMRACPREGVNSIAWLYWHMARTEDAAINLLVAEGSQVLDEEWRVRLDLTRRDIGTAMTDEEVREISRRINIKEMLAYRNAVGIRTREIARGIAPEELDVVIDADRIQALHHASALVEAAVRVARFWQGKTKRFLFNMPASGHSFMHLSEALTTRRMLGV